jgi:hypothetical protein
MTNYNMQCLRDYINAITKAERALREAEHDVWMVEEVADLYGISRNLREALTKVQEGMSQALYTAQGEE